MSTATPAPRRATDDGPTLGEVYRIVTGVARSVDQLAERLGNLDEHYYKRELVDERHRSVCERIDAIERRATDESNRAGQLRNGIVLAFLVEALTIAGVILTHH